jgi:tetratricopeptide (TPR) repeat protein
MFLPWRQLNRGGREAQGLDCETVSCCVASFRSVGGTVILTDRFSLPVSTNSHAARDEYVLGCDLLLARYPGATEAFDSAVAADPNFALAHTARALVRQLNSDMPAARGSMATSNALGEKLLEREASHIACLGRFLSGPPDVALAVIRPHLTTWPRDAMLLTTCAHTGGLIGATGRPGRERDLLAFLDSIAPEYGDDWWFTSHHAMALSESGQFDAARAKIERPLAQNPNNAWGAHTYAHLGYESGERDAARAWLSAWLATCPRDGLGFGHLSWHQALFELAADNVGESFRLYLERFVLGVNRGPALSTFIDTVSFLWRAELAGCPRDTEAWSAMHEFGHKMFPNPGNAMADWHMALTDAVTGDTATLETRAQQIDDLAQAGRYGPGDTVPSLSRGFAAFLRQDYDAAVAAIEPVVTQIERIGGSRAQRDLVEFTLLKACANAGRPGDTRRLIAARRPGPPASPVAGLPALH